MRDVTGTQGDNAGAKCTWFHFSDTSMDTNLQVKWQTSVKKLASVQTKQTSQKRHKQKCESRQGQNQKNNSKTCQNSRSRHTKEDDLRPFTLKLVTLRDFR